MANIVPLLLSNALVIFSSFIIPYSLNSSIWDWNTTFVAFFANNALLMLGWIYNSHKITRLTSILLIFGNLALFLTKNVRVITDTFWIQLAIVVLAISFYFTTINKETSHLFNTGKTIFIDWIIVIFLVPFSGFSDMLFDTNVFFLMVAYYLGSNYFVLGISKLLEFIWNHISHNQKDTSEELYFVHMFTIRKNMLSRLNLTLLLFTQTCLIFALFVCMVLNWDQVRRWQISFTIGIISSIYAYLGLIASGASISLQDYRELQDWDKKIQYEKLHKRE